MPGIARIGDFIDCGDVNANGSGNVMANGIPVTRINIDNTAGHGCYPPTVIASGSPNVFVNSIAVSRCNDPIVPHTCDDDSHGGNISTCSPDVIVN